MTWAPHPQPVLDSFLLKIFTTHGNYLVIISVSHKALHLVELEASFIHQSRASGRNFFTCQLNTALTTHDWETLLTKGSKAQECHCAVTRALTSEPPRHVWGPSGESNTRVCRADVSQALKGKDKFSNQKGVENLLGLGVQHVIRTEAGL